MGTRGRIRIVWLTCAPDENHKRDQGRSPSDVMGGRADELQAELDQIVWPECVIKLDTTGQTVEETIDTIEGRF